MDARNLELWADTELGAALFGYADAGEDALEVPCSSAWPRPFAAPSKSRLHWLSEHVATVTR